MKQKKIYTPVWFAALGLYISLYIVNSGSIQPFIILGVSMAVLFVAACFQRGLFQISLDGYFFYIVFFGLFCYASSLWAESSTYAYKKGNNIIVIFIVMIVFRYIFDGQDKIKDLLNLIKWGNYIVLAYAIISYGWNEFLYVLQNDTRISNDVLNANTLGMCAAYAVVINIYFSLYDRFKLTDLLMVPAVVILAASGSRKALVILIVGVFAVFILKNFDLGKLGRSILRIIFVILVLALLLLFLSQLSIFDGITERMEDLFTVLSGGGSSSTSGWIRMQYTKLGVELFKQHPILGIGIDNARLYTMRIYGNDHYLHNNYAELLACGGIVGIVLYYSIYAYILVTILRSWRLRDKEWDICLILLLIRLVMDYGAVAYESRNTYVYLLLFWLEAKKLRQKKSVTHSVCTENNKNQIGGALV